MNADLNQLGFNPLQLISAHSPTKASISASPQILCQGAQLLNLSGQRAFCMNFWYFGAYQDWQELLQMCIAMMYIPTNGQGELTLWQLWNAIDLIPTVVGLNLQAWCYLSTDLYLGVMLFLGPSTTAGDGHSVISGLQWQRLVFAQQIAQFLSSVASIAFCWEFQEWFFFLVYIMVRFLKSQTCDGGCLCWCLAVCCAHDHGRCFSVKGQCSILSSKWFPISMEAHSCGRPTISTCGTCSNSCGHYGCHSGTFICSPKFPPPILPRG